MELTMDYKALSFWFAAVQSFVMIAIGFYTWLTSKHAVNASAIDGLRDDVYGMIDDLDERTLSLEKDMEYMPSHEDMNKLHQRINEAAQRLTSVEGELKQINNTMMLMHQHLLNKKSN